MNYSDDLQIRTDGHFEKRVRKRTGETTYSGTWKELPNSVYLFKITEVEGYWPWFKKEPKMGIYHLRCAVDSSGRLIIVDVAPFIRGRYPLEVDWNHYERKKINEQKVNEKSKLNKERLRQLAG